MGTTSLAFQLLHQEEVSVVPTWSTEKKDSQSHDYWKYTLLKPSDSSVAKLSLMFHAQIKSRSLHSYQSVSNCIQTNYFVNGPQLPRLGGVAFHWVTLELPSTLTGWCDGFQLLFVYSTLLHPNPQLPPHHSSWQPGIYLSGMAGLTGSHNPWAFKKGWCKCKVILPQRWLPQSMSLSGLSSRSPKDSYTWMIISGLRNQARSVLEIILVRWRVICIVEINIYKWTNGTWM